jgi:hypothetical protein
MKNRNDQLSAIFRPLIGQKPWQVRLGYGSFITMEFGKKIRDSWVLRGEQHSSTRGEWHLWVYQCDWKLIQRRKPILSSDDSRADIAHVVEMLEGHALESVHVHGDDFNTDFEFRGGMSLRCTGYADEDQDDERWLLFMPGHKVLVNVPGMLVLQNSNQPERVAYSALPR